MPAQETPQGAPDPDRLMAGAIHALRELVGNLDALRDAEPAKYEHACWVVDTMIGPHRKPSVNGGDVAPSSAARVASAPLVVAALAGQGAEDARPGLPRSAIGARDTYNRQTRATLYNDIILVFLYENRSRPAPIVLSEISRELQRLGHPMGSSTIRGRISRMRYDGLLEKIADGKPDGPMGKTGEYVLTPQGVAAAETALRKRQA